MKTEKGKRYRVIRDSEDFFESGEIVVVVENNSFTAMCVRESLYVEGKSIFEYDGTEYHAMYFYELEKIDSEKEQIDNIIKHQDELLKYREIGTLDELRKQKQELEYELEQYHAIGMTSPEKAAEIYINYVINGERVAEYEAIGTLEECREAVEKQKGVKPTEYTGLKIANCPLCDNTVRMVTGRFQNWCSKCGQRLDWGNEGENAET